MLLLWSLGQWRLGSLGRRRWLRVSGLFDGEWYSRGCRDSLLRDLDPLFHYLTLGWKQGLLPAPGFSVDRYQWLLKEQGLSPWSKECSALVDALNRLQSVELELQALQMLIDQSVRQHVFRGALHRSRCRPFAPGLGRLRNLAYAFDAAGRDVRFHDLPMAGPLVDTEFATKCSEMPQNSDVLLVLPLSRVALAPLCGLRGRRRLLYP